MSEIEDKVLIIGSGSILWNRLKKHVNFNFIEVSGRDFISGSNTDICFNNFNSIIVFYYSRCDKDRLILKNKINQLSSKYIIYISTFPCILNGWVPRYIKNKKSDEIIFFALNNYSIFRIPIVDGLSDSGLYGFYPTLNLIQISDRLNFLLSNRYVGLNDDVNFIFYDSNIHIKLLTKFYALLFSLFRGNLFFLRFFDPFFKLLGSSNYGYTFAIRR